MAVCALRRCHRAGWAAAVSSLALLGCGTAEPAPVASAAAAEGFFRGVFACDPAAIERYGAEDVVGSYPIFETVYQTPAIRGRDAVLAFSEGFCVRWSDPQIVIHDAVVQDDRAVLVWEFSAVSAEDVATGDDDDGPPTVDARSRWGGISFFRFDSGGRVTEEVGEESTPGPAARLRPDGGA